jgi:hypothetical protein
VTSRAAVDAADAAGREDSECRPPRRDHRRGHGRGPVLAAREQDRQVAPAGLGHGGALFAQIFDFIRRETRLHASREHRGGRGHRARLPHGGFHRQGGLHIFRVGHPVGDNGRFQRHDGAVFA